MAIHQQLMFRIEKRKGAPHDAPRIYCATCVKDWIKEPGGISQADYDLLDADEKEALQDNEAIGPPQDWDEPRSMADELFDETGACVQCDGCGEHFIVDTFHHCTEMEKLLRLGS